MSTIQKHDIEAAAQSKILHSRNLRERLLGQLDDLEVALGAVRESVEQLPRDEGVSVGHAPTVDEPRKTWKLWKK